MPKAEQNWSSFLRRPIRMRRRRSVRPATPDSYAYEEYHGINDFHRRQPRPAKCRRCATWASAESWCTFYRRKRLPSKSPPTFCPTN